MSNTYSRLQWAVNDLNGALTRRGIPCDLRVVAAKDYFGPHTETRGFAILDYAPAAGPLMYSVWLSAPALTRAAEIAANVVYGLVPYPAA